MGPGASVNRFSNRMVNFDVNCIFFLSLLFLSLVQQVKGFLEAVVLDQAV